MSHHTFLSLALWGLALLLWLGPGAASAKASERVLMVLVSGLTVEDLLENPELELLKTVAEQGRVALVEPAAEGEASEPAAFLSVGAGVPVAAPRHTGPQFLEANIERSVADLAMDAFPAVGREGDIVSRGYRRRFGEYPPLQAKAVHVSLPALLRAQPGKQAERIGALGDALRAGRVSAAAYGDWRGPLVLMDRRGILMEGMLSNLAVNQMRRLLQQHRLMLVTTDSFAAIRRYTRVGLKLAAEGSADLMVVCPAPPTQEGKWTGSGFLVAAGPSFPGPGLLTSDSTHLPGYISSLDLAPSLLAMLGVRRDFGGEGHAFRKVPAQSVWKDLRGLNQQLRLEAKVRLPVLAAHAILALLAPLLLLSGIATRRRLLESAGRFGVWMTLASPLSFLLAAGLAVSRLEEYLASTLGASLLLALLASLLRRQSFLAPVAALVGLTGFAILGDIATGGSIAARSVIEEYTSAKTAVLLGIWGGYTLLLYLNRGRSAPVKEREPTATNA